MFFNKEFIDEIKKKPNFEKFNEILSIQLFFSSNYNFYIKQINIENFGEIKKFEYKKENKNTLIKYSSDNLKTDFLNAIKWCLNQNQEIEQEFKSKINFEKTWVQLLVCTENENDKLIEKKFIFSKETNGYISETLIDGNKYLFNTLLKGIKFVSNFGCFENKNIDREIEKLDSKTLNIIAEYFVDDHLNNASLYYDKEKKLQWVSEDKKLYLNGQYSESDSEILKIYHFLIAQKIDADNQRLFIEIPQNIDEKNCEKVLENILKFFPEHNIFLENTLIENKSKISEIVNNREFDVILLN